MSRTCICICLLLFAAVLPAAHADVDPFAHDSELNICTSKNAFTTALFCISDPYAGRYYSVMRSEEGLDFLNAYKPLENNIEAFLHLSLPKGFAIDMGIRRSPEEDYRINSNFGASDACDIQASCTTASGVVFAKAHKFLKNSTPIRALAHSPSKKADDSPFDIYAVGFKTAIGFLNITPQIAYASETPAYTDFPYEPADAAKFMLAISGEMRHMGFETELAYQNAAFSDALSPDETDLPENHLYGIYGNVWAKRNLDKVGLLFAYGSWDDGARQGYDFSNTYDVSLLSEQKAPLILDEASLNPWGQGLSGLILGRIYGEVAVGPNLFLMPSLTYLTDHVEGLDAFGYEINLAADYNLTDILTYSAAVAFAKTETITDLADPAINQDYKILQKLELKF